MIKIKNLDNITNETLDLIVEKFQNNICYRINDDRKTISFEKEREYFLFSNSGFGMDKHQEFTFIWIGKNLWQFRYTGSQLNTLVPDFPNLDLYFLLYAFCPPCNII